MQGRDDLRQDAVMQQVFVLVNRLLQKERETSKRNLNIRTYKVSGVVVVQTLLVQQSVLILGVEKYSGPSLSGHLSYATT